MAGPEWPVSQPTVDQGEKKVGPQQKPAHGRSTATQQPKRVRANKRVHDGKYLSSESLPLKHGARQQKQRAKRKVEADKRVSSSSSSSSKSRSSPGRRKSTRAGGVGPGGGDGKARRKPDTPVTTTVEERYRQRHRGTKGSAAGPHHPKRAEIARGGREGSSTSASSPSESGKFSYEHPSVWDVGQPVTGLADVDSASTMDGLLDREVGKETEGKV